MSMYQHTCRGLILVWGLWYWDTFFFKMQSRRLILFYFFLFSRDKFQCLLTCMYSAWLGGGFVSALLIYHCMLIEGPILRFCIWIGEDKHNETTGCIVHVFVLCISCQ